MSKKRIALGVSGVLGDMVLEYLAKRKNIEIVGVDTMTDREGQTHCVKTILDLNLPYKNYQEIVDLNPDIFISISYLKKIGKELLDNCLCVNMHVAKVPEYRGRNMFAKAIENGDKFYYATLLKMTENLDDGDIIAERKEPISFDDTSKTLYDRMQKVAFSLFKKEFDKLLNGSFKTKPQEGKLRYYKRDDLDKEVMASMDALDFYNKVRSLDFPPYSPAYLMIGDYKEELRKEDVIYNKSDNSVYVPRLIFGYKSPIKERKN